MPTGATFTPRAGPVVCLVFGLAAFPECEIGHGLAVILVGVVDFAGGVLGLRLEFALFEARETTVIFEGVDAEIDGAVVSRVGVAFLDQGFDERDLLRDMCDGARLDRWFAHVERVTVGVEFFGPLGGEFAQRESFFDGAADRLVVHIGDVAHVLDCNTVGFGDAAEHVLNEEGAKVADVCGAVNRGPAAVKAQWLVARRGEWFNGSAESVVKLDGHWNSEKVGR